MCVWVQCRHTFLCKDVCLTSVIVLFFLCAATSVDLKVFAILYASLCVRACMCVCVLFSSSVSV